LGLVTFGTKDRDADEGTPPQQLRHPLVTVSRIEPNPADPAGGPPYLSVSFSTKEKAIGFNIGYQDAMRLGCLLTAHAWPLQVEDGDEDSHYTMRNARHALEQFFLDRGDDQGARKARAARKWFVRDEDNGEAFALHADDNPGKDVECTVRFPDYDKSVVWDQDFNQHVDAQVTLADGQSGTVHIMLN
jgi:hypothetical protein